MLQGNKNNIKKQAMKKIENAVRGEIENKLIEISQSIIMDRVYGISASDYYKRTYQLLEAVDFKIIKSTNDSLTFQLEMNSDLLTPKKRPNHLDSYQSETGEDKRDVIFDKINEGRHRHHDRVRPMYIEKIQEELMKSEVIEQILAEALRATGWEVTIL